MQEQEHQNGIPLPLPPLNPDKERLFCLSSEERQLALEIKAAVVASPDLDNLSDLLYAQFAVVHIGEGGTGAGESFEQLMDRVRGLQAFREEYRITDTLEQGIELTTAFSHANPGAFLSVAYDDETENYGLIYDRSQIFKTTLHTEEEWRIMLGSTYYLFSSFCPDPHSTRQGMFFIGECEGMQSSSTVVAIVQRVWYHMMTFYPCRIRSVKFFHTNVVANVSYAMLKPFLPSHITNKMELGCNFGINLSHLYLLPTKEIATKKVLQRIGEFLADRQERRDSFQLR